MKWWNIFYLYPENHEGGWFSPPLQLQVNAHCFFYDSYVSTQCNSDVSYLTYANRYYLFEGIARVVQYFTTNFVQISIFPFMYINMEINIILLMPIIKRHVIISFKFITNLKAMFFANKAATHIFCKSHQIAETYLKLFKDDNFFRPRGVNLTSPKPNRVNLHFYNYFCVRDDELWFHDFPKNLLATVLKPIQGVKGGLGQYLAIPWE